MPSTSMGSLTMAQMLSMLAAAPPSKSLPMAEWRALPVNWQTRAMCWTMACRWTGAPEPRT